MKEPDFILEAGTKIRTSSPLGSSAGMLIKQMYLDARKPGVEGTIRNWVAGHGGDVYWVEHDAKPGEIAAYCWSEFDLIPPPPKTAWEHVQEDPLGKEAS